MQTADLRTWTNVNEHLLVIAATSMHFPVLVEMAALELSFTELKAPPILCPKSLFLGRVFGPDILWVPRPLRR